jgi:hypothetical protein
MEVTSPTLAGVSLIMVILRIIARRPGATDAYGWDDTIIIIAFLFAFPLAIIQYELGRHGLGRDIWMVSFPDITEVLKLFYLAEVFYLASTVLTKISILFFYLQVFTSYNFRRIVWVVIGACSLFFVGFIFALIFQCSPVSYSWTRWDGEHEGKCINIAAGVFAHATINMTLDLIVLILPLPLLYKLQLTYSVMGKIHIFIMFSFGLVVTIISALRLQTLIAFFNSNNPTYNLFGAALWSGLETFIGIICACLPAAKVFFFRIAPKWLGLSTIGSGGATAGTGPGQRASKSWATSSRASSANRLSKPPQRASAVITPIPEDDADLLAPQGKETPSTVQSNQSYSKETIQEEGDETLVGSSGDTLADGEPVDEIESTSKRISWIVTGQRGTPLESFSSPKFVNNVQIEEYDLELGATSRREWPVKAGEHT